MNLPQNAEFLHSHEEEKTSSLARSGCRIGTKCVRKPAQAIRRSLEFGQKIQTVKLSKKFPTSCRIFAIWRTFAWRITTCWTFLERFMTFTIMWLCHVRSREQKDRAWVDRAEEFGDLIFLDHAWFCEDWRPYFWISDCFGWYHFAFDSISM